MTEPSHLVQELRTPRAAAVAGIAFAVILGLAIILMHASVTSRVTDPGAWIEDASQRRTVGFALALIPYAGIAFLWFIGVIRHRLGANEDKLFATVFLGSGLLFVSMLFAAAAVMGSLLVLYGQPQSVGDDTIRLGGALTTALLATFGARMAAVFTLVVTTLGRRTGIIPTWLVIVGYASAVVLLLTPPGAAWVQLVFPAWVLLLSLHILIGSIRPPSGAAPGEIE